MRAYIMFRYAAPATQYRRLLLSRLRTASAPWFLVLMWLLPVSAHSWDALGHQQSAALVFDQLSPAEQQYWSEVLRQHPRFTEDFLADMPGQIRNADSSEQQRWLFARAGYWPDIARGIPDAARAQFNRPNWHWIDGRWVRADVPRQGNVYLHMAPLADINGLSDQQIRQDRISDNVLTALVSAEAALHQPLSNADSSKQAELAVALCWYLHLGADIHQPLHAGALYHDEHLPDGDRGGNLVRLTTQGNLHALWDQALRGSSPEQLTAAFERLDARQVGQGFTPGTWLMESREFLHEDVYTRPVKVQIAETAADSDRVTVTLEEEYRPRMQAISLQRIAQSAARLAQTLKAMDLP